MCLTGNWRPFDLQTSAQPSGWATSTRVKPHDCKVPLIVLAYVAHVVGALSCKSQGCRFDFVPQSWGVQEVTG